MVNLKPSWRQRNKKLCSAWCRWKTMRFDWGRSLRWLGMRTDVRWALVSPIAIIRRSGYTIKYYSCKLYWRIVIWVWAACYANFIIRSWHKRMGNNLRKSPQGHWFGMWLNLSSSIDCLGTFCNANYLINQFHIAMLNRCRKQTKAPLISPNLIQSNY